MTHITKTSAETAPVFLSSSSFPLPPPRTIKNSITSYSQAAAQSRSPSLWSQLAEIGKKICIFFADLVYKICSYCSGASHVQATQVTPTQLADQLFNTLIQEAEVFAQEVKTTFGEPRQSKFDCTFYMSGTNSNGEIVGLSDTWDTKKFSADTSQQACQELISSLKKNDRFFEMLQNGPRCSAAAEIQFFYNGWSKYKQMAFILDGGTLRQEVRDTRTNAELFYFSQM